MLKRFLLSLAAALALVPLAAAQTTTGTIRGTVSDAEGGVLPGVTLTVTGDRGVERVVTSGADGSYLIASVPPGDYGIEAALEGMLSQRAADVRVTIGGTATVDFTLDASFTEEMTVTAESPLLDLTSSEAPTNYQAEFIEDIPTRRSFWDMVSVSPGMSQTSEFTDRQSAFGSSITSNSWNIDGLNVTASETGAAWWYINPETIEEVQVLGIGASAEFGNMTGAAINVVTKSGGNEYEGTFNSYLQFDELTDTNVELPDTAHPSYVRDHYNNETLTFGGPIQRDRAWFFGALEYYDDAETVPGGDPAFPAEYYWERYDLKLDWSPSPRTQVDAKYHYEDYSYDDSASAFVEPSARGEEYGTNPAWGAGFSYTLSDRTLLEIHYAGWSGDDFYHSSTRSTEDAFVDFDPPGGDGTDLYTGGLTYPYDYELSVHQGDIKMSHYAADFLGGDHDFRFGVEYMAGSADTITKASSGGDYYYHYTYFYDYYGTIYPYEYYYRYTFTPFHYGAKNTTASAFFDDAWRVSDRLTVNVGLRYDVLDGRIPDYPRLDSDGNPTGETIPGKDDVIDWKVFSPRLGFAWVATDDARTVLRGSVGVYHDGNVTGNWEYPPPQAPPLLYFACEGPPPAPCNTEPDFVVSVSDVGVDPNLDAPRSVQYALGLERQLTDTMALGAQLVYKESKDLIGWEILGDGVYEPVLFTDPVTGQQYTLLNICDEGCQAPTIRKGNRPGVGSLAPDEEYHQEYRAAILTFERRYTDWGVKGSYTWSRSEGLIPRPSNQTQGGAFYFEIDGSDPNEWINADQLLQNDREHMFRVQGNADLPWNMEVTGSLNWQSGRPYNRQARAGLDQGSTWIIVEPNSDDRRLPSTFVLDAGIGKRWNLGADVVLKTDLQVLNLFNEDANQFWETQRLNIDAAGNLEPYVPDSFVYPRRGMIRIGLEF